jgi:hypothetical protein
MPVRRDRSQGNNPDFLKRRNLAQGKAEIDAAHAATQRLYCDALRFWRRCARRDCRRHRRCCGDPAKCLGRGSIFVPQSRRQRAQKDVIAGGPRRVAPARHIEWSVRRTDFRSLLTWGLTRRRGPQEES